MSEVASSSTRSPGWGSLRRRKMLVSGDDEGDLLVDLVLCLGSLLELLGPGWGETGTGEGVDSVGTGDGVLIMLADEGLGDLLSDEALDVGGGGGDVASSTSLK